jgi:hypothetical protein
MMNRGFSSFSNIVLSCMLSVALAVVSGCALQNTAPAGSNSYAVPGAGVTGRALGGGIPINGAQVTLWETSFNGYPGSTSTCYDAATSDTVYTSLCTAASRSTATSIVLATTTTSGSGGFSFTTGSYVCDSLQYVYITATGGNTGAGVNTQSVQIAPLGSCSNFQTTTQESKVNINMGEATTVATAYALGNFMYTTDNGTGKQVVYVSAPPTNFNGIPTPATGTPTSFSGSGSCTSPSGAATPPNTTTASLTYAVTCAAAGLAHAFANAANIVDAVHFDNTTASGSILAAPISNSSGLVPQALLNTIANALESCTNSASTAASPSTRCTNLFTATTPATATNGASSTAPANELQAMLNLAKDPASAAATNSLAGIYALSAPQNSSFIPALSAAPADYSVAIWYPGTSTTAFGYPVDAATDANDNVYVLVSDAKTPTISGVASLTYDGGSNFAATTSTAYCAPGQIATDTIGNVWASNNTSDVTAGDPCVAELVQYSAANGTVASAVTGTTANPYGLAIDRYNDVWFGRSIAIGNTLVLNEVLYSNGGGTGGTFGLPATPTHTNNPIANVGSVAIDPHQNVWIGTTSSAATQPAYNGYVLPNLTSANVPFYGYSNGNEAQNAPLAALPGTAGNGIAIDASGIAWAPTSGNVSKLTPSYTSQVIFSITKYSVVYGTNSDEFEGTSTTNPYVGAVPGAFVLSAFPTSTFLNGAVVGITVGTNSAVHANGTLYPVHAAVGSTTETGTATVPASINSAAVTNSATSTTTPNSKAEFDGTGALWYGNNATASTIYYYQPSNSASVSLSPCFLASSATACASTPYFGLNGFAIDSTGSLWISVNSEAGSTGGALQVLGSAGPTVPQLSAGFPATKP